jgi:L-ribulose-5-phosphate 3-epimerase
MIKRFSGRVGVIQGRLSPRPAHRIQAFPRATWQREFESAKNIGFDCIEWIFEAEGAADNPVSSSAGRHRIIQVIADSGVAVSSICGDYFMVRKLAGGEAGERKQNVELLKRVIDWAAELGARRILLPLLETAAVDTPELADHVVESLTSAARTAESCGIVLGLEMEIPGPEYVALVRRVAHPCVRVYYDTGNSTAQGIDIGQDVQHVLPELEAVHVKDRKTHGGTQPLGSGDTNFRGFFQALAKRGFAGDFVLQHYFAGDPLGDAAKSLTFVKACQAEAAREAA